MRMVYCTFSVIGYHQFDDAPEEVKYLRDNHRHEFRFKVSIEIKDANREIEFHTLIRFCVLRLYSTIPYAKYSIECNELQFGGMSCEMIAAVLMGQLLQNRNYSNMPGPTKDTFGKPRQIIIEVSEDGECGGVVTRFE